jgi:hypothetical protein
MTIHLKATSTVFVVALVFLPGCSNGEAQTSITDCLEESKFSSTSTQSQKSTGLFPVMKNRQWGFINRTGQLVIQPQFPNIGWLSEDRLPVGGKNGKWGFVDATGQVIVEPKFENVGSFREQRASIKLNGKLGFIDSNGKITVKPQFTQVSPFFEGRAFVQVGYLWGVIDPNGQVIAKPQFTKFTYFSEGLAGFAMTQNKQYKTGFIDRNGKIVVELKDIILDLEGVGLRHGLAPAYRKNSDIGALMDEFFTGRHQKSWGFIDRTGKIAIPLKYDSALGFENCLAFVKLKGKWGAINTKGETLIEPRFDKIPRFSEGLAALEINQKYGYVDKTGKLIIEPRFYDASIFSDVGLASVRTERTGKWGAIDRSGKVVMQPQFDEPVIFVRGYGLARVKIGDKLGYIDKTGKYIWKPTN